MKHAMMRSRRARYGGMTVSLTVVLIAALVLLNVIFFTLAKRYAWYVDMTPDKVYSVSELCHSLIDDTVDRAKESGEDVKVDIIFCEDYRTYAPGSAGAYIVNTAKELVQSHPDVFELSWFDCYLDVSYARELGVTGATNVVMRASNGESRVFHQQEFFTFEGSNTTTPVGYDGERAFATTLSSLLADERPLACFTLNHDEKFYDETLLYLLRDAGYTVSLIDLYYEDIPANCSLLVTYNPSIDFIVADGVSERSELQKLQGFLDKGNSLMVFLSSTTPVLPNFESLLADYGVAIQRDEDAATGRAYNAMVKDASAALTSDGFTIYGRYAEQGHGAELLSPLTERDFAPGVVFRDATVLTVPAAFAPVSDGSYRDATGARVRYDLLRASSSAIAWANGKQLEDVDGTLPLLTLSHDTATGARVTVCSSTEYAAEAYLESAVFGNADVLLCTLREMGQEDVLVGLRYKPFAGTDISSITTAQTTRWTVALTVVPAVLVLAVATIVLVRRKYS